MFFGFTGFVSQVGLMRFDHGFEHCADFFSGCVLSVLRTCELTFAVYAQLVDDYNSGEQQDGGN